MPRKQQGQRGKHVREPAEPAAPSPIEAKLIELFPDAQIAVPIVGGGRRAVSAWEPWQRTIIERALVGEFGEDDALQTLDHASKLPMIRALSEILLEHEQADRQRANAEPAATAGRSNAKPRGRPRDTDPTADAALRDEWQTFARKTRRATHAQFAAQKQCSVETVKAALERARKHQD